MTEDQIKHMTERFLSWRLPTDFAPDNGVSYKRPNYAPEVDATPCGTNLFDHEQAEAMVRHMTEGLPDAAPDLLEALMECVGHFEIAAVMPDATGKAYVPPMDADFLERARDAIAKATGDER